jgi:nucleotide-binding universal stress UspA family protein
MVTIDNGAAAPAGPGSPGVTTAWMVVVVGFDGSEPSQRALLAARRLVSGRPGSVEVVFVAHPSAASTMSPYAQVESGHILDEEAAEAETLARDLLGGEQRWHFHRRDGSIADQLVAAAAAEVAQYGPAAEVLLVVGRAVHAYHQVMGSVPAALVRHGGFPVLVIP